MIATEPVSRSRSRTDPTGTAFKGPTPSSHRPGPQLNAAEDHSRRFPRLSRPVELMRHEYDVVVIGSGYGGGVAASRMARAKQNVCVLERGKERWPGEYPESLGEVLSQLHVSGNIRPDNAPGIQVDIGKSTGLYHLVVGEGQNAFVANGLGGGSLLNANIFLEADERTLSLDRWPKEIRQDPNLEKHYERARHMLQPEPYPEHYPRLPKLDLLQQQAELLGLEHNFYRPPQTTRFVDGVNNVGVMMQASTLTGMDSTGVNDGSKSSTLVTYIADAWNWGAEIFCECEVRYITKHPQGGYNIFFAWHGAKRGYFSKNFYENLMWVRAKELVFLGAGTLGTTEILLRSQENGLSMSPTLGTGMSGNGNILAFGHNCDMNVNGLGRPNPLPGKPIGPTISGIIDCRNQSNVLDGFVIEEGAIPKALTPLLQTMLNFMPGQLQPKISLTKQLKRSLWGLGSCLSSFCSLKGTIERTQVYLVMSHDSDQAMLTLKDDKPVLQFSGVGRSGRVQYLKRLLANATNAVGGTLVNNPFYAAFGQQEVTVHPIGGACMSSDGTANTGVTSHIGEVFKQCGSDVHSGLVVCDGAVVPTALGVNPYATITALAERSVEAVAVKAGLKIDYETKNGLLDLFSPAAHYLQPTDLAHENATQTVRRAKRIKATGIEFSEIMSGYIHLSGNVRGFRTATKAARAACQYAQFFLSVHAWDMNELISSSAHTAMLTGTFTHSALPASPYMCRRGTFQFFNEDRRTPDTTNLVYDFDMVGTDGSTLHFNGYKLITPAVFGSPWRTWEAASTLYVTITQKDEKNLIGGTTIVGRGTLCIGPLQLMSQLATLTPSGEGLLSEIFATTRFLTFFTKQIARVFLGPLNTLKWPLPTHPGFLQKSEATEIFHVKSSDGVVSVVHHWAPTSVNIKSTPLLLIPGAAVDHQIFALPTIKENSVEYFTKAGYHVYCLTHRVGRTKVAEQGWTTCDARLDIHAALKDIRRRRNDTEKVYVVCHCAGAIAFSCGMLDGTIPAPWVAGVTASNVFFNPIFATVNMIKAKFPISLASTYSTLINKWYSCSSSPKDSYFQQGLNQLLRFYPVGSRKELCNSVVCHRSKLVFGRLWTHRNLNEATHSNLSRFLGGTSMASLQYMITCGTKGEVLMTSPRYGRSLVTATNLRRLEGVPILFFSGAENAVYTPESTLRSYETLRDMFGPENYERNVFQGKGHLDCWMGQSSINDVWPRVLAHVTKVTKDLELTSVDETKIVCTSGIEQTAPKICMNARTRRKIARTREV